jgi:DNA-binding CsgD family transcriptional regulator
MQQTHSAYGMQLLAPHMHEALLSALRVERGGVEERAPFHLSRTEMQLLSGLVAGLTTDQIAQTSFRSRHTIANQIRSIIRKLNAKNRTEAISKALGSGLIDAVERSPRTRIIAAQPVAAYKVRRLASSWRGRYRRLASSRYDGPFIR